MFIIFGRKFTEEVSSQQIIYFSTSPN